MSIEQKTTDTTPDGTGPAPQVPPWARATPADLAGLDFEAPIAQSTSAESTALGDLFGASARALATEDRVPDTPSARVFQMLGGACGMLLQPAEPNEPFAAMAIFPGKGRSAIPSDFMGPPLEALVEMASLAKHPTLRARLGDLCWLLDRKRGALAGTAASAYVEIVEKVDSGVLKFQFDEDARGALRHRARDLLRRALFIGRAIGMEKPGPAAARALAVNLRARAVEKLMPAPALWFGHLELDFRITDAGQVGEEIEALIARLPATTDTETTVNLWRLAARAYHLAKRDSDRYRCQISAAELLAATAEQQPMAMMGSHMLSQAIAELHGVPGQKDRRKELRHRLVDVQAGIVDEMSPFAHPIDLTALVQWTEQQMQRPSLRDELFVFAALMSSPDPAQLAQDAEKRIRESPLSSLFEATHHDREGKVVHRSEGAGFGDSSNDSAVERQIAQDEGIRRNIGASGKVEVARQAIVSKHYITEEMFAWILVHSAFVPQDVLMTYSRGFARFFQGDFVSGLYILTPLLENSLRHVLKSHGHDVTKLNDATLTQEDRTISSLFKDMRGELNAVFGEAITADIERVFLKKSGPYLRHGVAHGLLHDGTPYGPDALYGCWLIFHLCMLPLFEHRERLSLPFDDFSENIAPSPAGAPAAG
jgi:hypothetical protein